LSVSDPLPDLDIARARAETPGVAHVVHFNNAGCALPPAPVVEAMVDHLRLEAAIGGYEALDRHRDAAERPYAALADTLGAAVDDIAIVDNATRAWDLAFYGLRLGPGDRILTATTEYASNFIAFLQRARRDGVAIDVAPATATGEVDVDALAALIGPHTRLVALTHVPSTGGLVNPVAEVGAVTRRAGVPFLLDACQSIGQMPVDVRAIGCDLLSGTARKFLRGPRGMGFLYVRGDLAADLEPPFLDDHAADWTADRAIAIRRDARRFETPECSYAAKIGFGVALDYAAGWPIAAVERRVTALAETLRRRLTDELGAAVHDTGARRCGIVTFTLPDIAADAIKAGLARSGINVTVAIAETTRLDMVPRGLSSVVRASLHYYNTEEEIGIVLEALARLPRA
jgi:selenocysteine lyase/cysteine desulfurase